MSEEEDEFETEYTESDGGVVVQQGGIKVANMTGKSVPQRVIATEEDEDEEDEDEWETETASDVQEEGVMKLPTTIVAQTSEVSRPAVQTTKAVVAASEDDDEDEWTTEEGEYTEDDSVDARDTGTLLKFLQECCVRQELLTLLHTLFSADSVASTAVARDFVSVTVPTRHCLVMLRNAAMLESRLVLPFQLQKSPTVYQDVVHQTLLRTGTVLFREQLSTTVTLVKQLERDLEVDSKAASGAVLEANQKKLEEVTGKLLDGLFAKKAVDKAPRLFRCALWILRDELRGLSNGNSVVASFLTSAVLGRILADPVKAKITSSLTPVAHRNLVRVSKLVAALVIPDVSIGPHFSAWCQARTPQLMKWIEELAQDPTGKRWAEDSIPMTSLPLKESTLVQQLHGEFGNLKMRLNSQREQCPIELSSVLQQTVRLLTMLASGGLQPGGTPGERSVRNLHRKVPHEIHELQKEIRGLEDFSLDRNGRKLVSQGLVSARKGNREEDGHLFLFSDLLLYCKHNPPEDTCLFEFNRSYKLHQVIVRSLESESEKAAFSISAFAQPYDYDLILFASNANDKDRWVDLIRKKQEELRASLFARHTELFLVDEIAFDRSVPVQVTVCEDVLFKLVPMTDKVIASYDIAQLHALRMEGDTLVLDFNRPPARLEEARLRLRGERLAELRAALDRESKRSKYSDKLPDVGTLKQSTLGNSGLGYAEVTATREPTREPQKPTSVKNDRNTTTTTTTNNNSNNATTKIQTSNKAPRSGAVPPKDKGEMEPVIRNEPGPVPESLIVRDHYTGQERDLWNPEERAHREQAHKKAEARKRRQRERERRQALREQGGKERSRRLDEDKALFFESLDRSLKRMVVVPDDSALRRPEELTDQEILGLQRRAYKWKREAELLRQLLYTQYVCSHAGHGQPPSFSPPAPASK